MQLDYSKIDLARARGIISVRELCERAGITQKWYHVLRNNPSKLVVPETAGKIAKALGVDPSEIIKTEQRTAAE